MGGGCVFVFREFVYDFYDGMNEFTLSFYFSCSRLLVVWIWHVLVSLATSITVDIAMKLVPSQRPHC